MRTAAPTLILLLLAPVVRAQWVVTDPGNTLVNTAIKANQVAQHAEILRQWAEQLERLNWQIRQLEDMLVTERRIRDVMGDPVSAGVQVAGALGAKDLAREYGETMAAVRRLSDAAQSLRRTAEGVYRQLDDRTSLGASFARRLDDYRPYAAVESQTDDLEAVHAETEEREQALQAELAQAVASLRTAQTQAEVDKLNATIAALNGQLAFLASRRRDAADRLAAQRIGNENQAEKERRDLFEKQAAEERQTTSRVNAWQDSIRLTPTRYARP